MGGDEMDVVIDDACAKLRVPGQKFRDVQMSLEY